MSTSADAKIKDDTSSVPRGKPKSGKVWKTVRAERHSAMRISKSLKTSWESKMAKKREAVQFKERIQTMKEEQAKEKQRLRKLTDEKRKQKLENERKSEVVQVIKNTAKIKKMKKKQLRSIQMR